ncbi:VOC family protein [Gaiella sp.]|jgi:catechol 2,3-dioxygenase-like lactoylglutathione lyase family enzyme|uniref:VOC family protein n=1 Tax=Gaiella sp. TaxID=2663207 RepID=UPI002E306BE2|nr:VOC family protein [Gaiella sp.]HEX5585311.1 VOC family protein [Gaiella sp.]
MALRRLDHVLVLTDDLDATRAFYCDVLGLEIGERPELPFPGYWLSLDGTPCLHVAERSPYEAHAASLGLAVGAAPVDHVAFVADDDGALAGRLAAVDLRVTENVPGPGKRQLFVDDPNGVRVEVNLPAGDLAGRGA